MHSSKKLLSRGESAEAIFLCVLPIAHGGFGVYANTVLVAAYDDHSAADTHCQRLLNQQAEG